MLSFNGKTRRWQNNKDEYYKYRYHGVCGLSEQIRQSAPQRKGESRKLKHKCAKPVTKERVIPNIGVSYRFQVREAIPSIGACKASGDII